MTMTTEAFPFAQTAESADFDDADTAGNNKKAMVAGGAIVALVVGAGAFLLLGGGGGGDASYTVIPRAPRVAHAAAAPQAAPKTTGKKLPLAYPDQLGRDPFKALYAAPLTDASGAVVTSTTSTSSTTATTATVPTVPTTTTTSSSSSSGTATQAAPAPVTTRYALKLVSISQLDPEARYTTWTVDGAKKTVLPGQKFGKYGELVVLAFSKNAQGVVDKAILQVGDDSPIDVPVGQSNSVL